MAGKKRTRQSNREYQERIRRESYQAGEREAKSRSFRVIPSEESNHRQRTSVQQKRTQQKPIQSNRTQPKNSKPKRTQYAHSPADDRKKNRSWDEQRQPQPKRMDRSRDSKRVVEKKPQVYFDYTLVFIVFFLVMFGLLMLYTASIYTSGFFLKQCMFTLLGFVVMYVVSRIDYHIYFKKEVLPFIAIGAVIFVFLVKTPLGVSLNGASRWVNLGFTSVQPAEIFKIAVIIFNAFLLTKYTKRIGELKICATFALMAALECLFILVVTQNLSSGLIIGMITILMLFVAHPGYKVFVTTLIAGGGAVAGIIYYILNFVDPSKDFRFGRIYAWLAPERLPDQSKVYQTNQALYSIGSGGLWGKGLGAGTQKMILPEAMNDMIFAIICEELGMIGAFLVLIMFAILLYRLVFIAKNSKDLLGGMLAVGIFAHFMLQVSLNIGVVTGLLPSTGVTLPFISYGGTAQVLLLAEIGIALNVSRQIDFEMPKLKRRKVRKNVQR